MEGWAEGLSFRVPITPTLQYSITPGPPPSRPLLFLVVRQDRAAEDELGVELGSEVDVALRREEVPPGPAEVAGWVCERFEVKKEELLRGRGNSAARDLAMKALHELSGLTKREVGRMLGHADGATVGKRLKMLKDEMSRRRGLRKSWDELYNSVHIANCKA